MMTKEDKVDILYARMKELNSIPYDESVRKEAQDIFQELKFVQ